MTGSPLDSPLPASEREIGFGTCCLPLSLLIEPHKGSATLKNIIYYVIYILYFFSHATSKVQYVHEMFVLLPKEEDNRINQNGNK